jgi:iron(III) transport system permease protein
MMVFALTLSAIYLRILSSASRYQIVTGKSYAPRAVTLGRWGILAWAFAGLYIVATLVLPITLTSLLALLPYAQPLSGAALQNLSWVNFARVPWDLIRLGALHTLLLVVSVPLVVVAASLAFSYIAVRTRNRFRGVVDAIAFLPHAIPGILFAVAASLVSLFVFRDIIPIYGTVTLIGLIYVVAWLSLGTRVMNSALVQIHDELVEAATACGASRFTAFRRIVLPLVRPAIARLWLFVILLCMRELTLAAFVSSPRNATLPLVGFALWTGGELNRAAAVTVLIFLALLPPLAIYFRIARPGQSL